MTFKEVWDNTPDGPKHLGDALSITTLLGALSEMLPHVAALLTIVWTLIRIIETDTVQRWLKKRRDK